MPIDPKLPVVGPLFPVEQRSPPPPPPPSGASGRFVAGLAGGALVAAIFTDAAPFLLLGAAIGALIAAARNHELATEPPNTTPKPN